MSKLEELIAIYEYERHRWDDTVIAEVRPVNGEAKFFDFEPPLAVKVVAEEGQLVMGLTYRFYGSWTSYYNQRTNVNEKQFDANKGFCRTQPHTESSVVRYLMQAPNIGLAISQKLWKAFGGDAVRIVRESPDKAAASVGGQFTEPKAVEAAAWLEKEKQLEQAVMAMMDLLGGRGFPNGTDMKAIKEWGGAAPMVVANCPYRLQIFRGVGFTRCDNMYLDRGGDPHKLSRQARLSSYVIRCDREGHTWYTKEWLVREMGKKLSFAQLRPVEAVKLAKRARMVATRRAPDPSTGNPSNVWVGDWNKARNELAIAKVAAKLMRQAPLWPDVAELDVSDHQRQELAKALQSRIGIFSGTPGTGKTYSAACVIKKLIEEHGSGQVAVCAPTGKAAVRISEAMERYGISMRATTIHSLLSVARSDERDDWSFEHDDDNPLPFRIIVVDESSMCDTDLTACLLRALPEGGCILFVGDTNQLPPVGHGAPLRDMIAAGVPTGELAEIWRNSGTIVRVCQAIRNNQQWACDDAIDPAAGKNLKLIPAVDGAQAVEKIVASIKKLGAKGLVNPVWDCQVIVAVNEKSVLSRKDLNKRLQAELNPTGRTVGTNPFRERDKVVCLKNGLYLIGETTDPNYNLAERDGKVFVANGELGEVVEITDKYTAIKFDLPKRLIKVYKGKVEGDEESDSESGGKKFDLGYAISCHKSQGSEWPVIFVALDEYPGALMVASWEWLYTAISRAKQACYLVGKQSTALSMCRRVALGRRKTFLKELINEHYQDGAAEGEPGTTEIAAA